MEILNEFGVNGFLLAAQVVNFLILLFLLKKFLYKPILKVLEDRKSKIAQSIKNSEEIEKRLVEISAEREEKIKEAYQEANQLIKDATLQSDKIIHEAHMRAEKDIKKLVERAHQSLSQEEQKLQNQIKSQLSVLIVEGVKSVIGKSLDEKEKKELVDSSIKNLT